MKIILGSTSKPRKLVLENNNFVFEIMSPNIDEMAIHTDDYYQLPLLLARAKAEALVPKILEDAIVITADQVTVCNSNLYEKPRDKDDAIKFLQNYSDGHPAETVSALVVTNIKNGKRADGVDIAKTYYNHIPKNIIEEFIEKGDPFSKSGGFDVSSPILKPYLNRIEGTFESIMGMPLHLLDDLMNQVN
ncbi:MAG: Maf family protein [Bacteroidia bacterium]